MNAIHQISLKLRLGIDTQANIQPEVLLKKWQDLNDRKLYTSTLSAPSERPHPKELKSANSSVIRRN